MYRLALLSLVAVIGSTKLVSAQPGDKNKKNKLNKIPPAAAKLLDATPEQFIKRFDKNNDGVLTKDELPPRLAAVFDRADQNGDGKLDADEVARMLDVLRQRMKQTPNKAGAPAKNPELSRRVDEIFNRLDTNKDGKISREEAKGPLEKNFDAIDRNKDGFLDKAEVSQVIERMNQRKLNAVNPGSDTVTAPVRRLADFDALDLDADGRLSKDEIAKSPFPNQFDDMDTNKDGKIDRKEFEAFLKKQASAISPGKSEKP
jgi:Ca2+-binding EF-hand superfamily protein